MDDFEKNLTKWTPTTSGVGASITLSTDTANNGNQSVKRVTGAAINNYARLDRSFPYPKLTNFGLEAHFTLPDNLVFLEFDLYVYDGTNYHVAIVRINTNTGRLQVATPTGALVTIATGLNMGFGSNLFHLLKFVADFSKDKYKRLIFDNLEYDISQQNMWTAADATAPQLMVRAELVTFANANKTSYLDDVIITQNEP
jgi:hypothetical protein